MRKINTDVVLNPNTFNPVHRVFIVNDDGSKEKLEYDINEKYSLEDAAKIRRTNEALVKNGYDVLADDEIEYLTRKIKLEEPTETDLQKLAGFTVEKKIIYEHEKRT